MKYIPLQWDKIRNHSLGPGPSVGQKQADFLRSTSLLYKILPTNLVAPKPAFYFFYTFHI